MQFTTLLATWHISRISLRWIGGKTVKASHQRSVHNRKIDMMTTFCKATTFYALIKVKFAVSRYGWWQNRQSKLTTRWPRCAHNDSSSRQRTGRRECHTATWRTGRRWSRCTPADSNVCTTTTTTTTVLRPFVRDYAGEPVPEETLTRSPILVINLPLSDSSIYHDP